MTHQPTPLDNWMPSTGMIYILGAAGVLLFVSLKVMPAVTSARNALKHRRLIKAATILAMFAAAWWAVSVGYPLPVLAVVVLGGGGLWTRRRRSAFIVGRWGDRSRRTNGVATITETFRHGSWWTLRRTMAHVRPTRCAGLTRRQRCGVRACELGFVLARVGLLRVHASYEDVTLTFGGPRTGKTEWLCGGPIMDYPGALIVTSTRTDVIEKTRRHREANYGPCYVFNAAGIAGIESSVTFDPLTGCSDPIIAQERAIDMVGGVSADGDAARWLEQARRVMAAMLHAAALGDRQMRHVLRWVSDPENAAAEIDLCLERSTEPAYRLDVKQFIETGDRTRTSITTMMMPALGWLSNPSARQAAAPGAGFDVARLLDERATVYLLGAEEANTAPLMCALTGHIARQARRLAAYQPGGRLDPGLGMRLDECALTSPVPLESWSADMGGRGVNIVAAFQSVAQLRMKWGRDAAAVILNNAGNIILFGGTKDEDDLRPWSNMLGQRDQLIPKLDDDGHITGYEYRQTPTFPPATLMKLPRGQAVIIRRGMSPSVGRPPAWSRRPAIRRPWWFRIYCQSVDTYRRWATGPSTDWRPSTDLLPTGRSTDG